MRRIPVTAAITVLIAGVMAGCKEDATQLEFLVAPADVALMVGESRQLSAVGAPGAVEWSSGNTAVARVVAETGFVTAVGRGETQVTAVSGSVFATARVVVTAPPALALSSPTIDFEITRGEPDPAARTVNVTNAGDGTLAGLAVGTITFAAGQATGWLIAQLGGTSAPATLTLRAQAGTLPAGTYNAVVPVTAQGVANSPQNVAVTFRIVAPASIVLSRTSVPMATIPGSTVQETVEVTNGGGRPLTGLAAAVTYLTGTPGWLTPQLSTTTAPATLTLRANATGLAQGNYTANVVVSSTVAGVASRTIGVALTVGPGPAIQLTRTSVPFFVASGGTAPAAQTVNVTNSGGGTLDNLSLGAPVYMAGQPTGWATAALDRPLAPAVVTLNVNPTGLAAGTYTATIQVRSTVASNSPLNLTVSLTIGPPPVIAVNPTSVTFTTYSGGNLPGAQVVQVTNSGGGTLAGLSASVVYGPGASGWLSFSYGGGNTTAPTNLFLQPNTAALARGSYTATVTVSSSIPGIASRAVTVTYNVSSFSVDIAPLFTAGNPGGYPRLPCNGCHAALGGTVAQRHAYLTGTGSALVMCKITGNAACPSEMTMPPGMVALIGAWFAAGAPSN
jgi:hypothetical protein